MAYTLNTSHPLHANLLELIGVKDGALVSHITTRTFTKHAEASYKTGGAYGESFQTVGGGFTVKGASFTPDFDLNTSTNPNITQVIVVNAITGTGGGGQRNILGGINTTNASNAFSLGVNSTGLVTALTQYNALTTTGTSDLDTPAAAHMLALKRTGETAHEIWVDGSTDSTGGRLAYNASIARYNQIGGTSGQGSVAVNVVWIAVFDKVLSEAELDDLYASLGADNAFGLVASAAPDTTAPTLTTPTGTQTGSTTASGTVSTDEANGTLYYLASTNATETVTTVKAASSQAVTATGSQAVSFTGLTASTTYYAHYVHRDAAGNDSTVATGASFTTAAPAGDTTAPTLTGSITVTSLTTTSYTASWPAGSDNVGVTGYEYQIDAGGWTSVGTALTVNISGRTPATSELFQVRAFDAAGNRSIALTQSVTLATPVAGVTITDPLKNNTGTLLASQSGVGVALLQTGDFTYGLTTNAAGILETISGAVAGQSYYVAIKLADGSVGITGPITAS